MRPQAWLDGGLAAWVDPLALAAILGMAAVTYATRIAGWWLIARLTLSGRTRAGLEAMPGAVLTALVAPTALATGPAETVAAAVALLSARRLPFLAAVMLGVATVIVLRRLVG